MDKNLRELLANMNSADKIEALAAMGFARTRASHTMGCLSIQGSGFICTCTAPSSRWVAPNDVKAFLGESEAERKAYTARRNDYFDDGVGERPEDWVI